MAKTLKDLILALLNATLILVVLCLVLGLMVVNRANSVTATFAENLNVVAPLQESVQATGAEVAALRTDLATLRDESQDLSSATMMRIQDRVTALETKLDGMQESLSSLRDAPKTLIDHAIATAGDQAVQSIGQIKGCVPAADPAT